MNERQTMAEHSFQEVMKQWRRMCKAFSETTDCEGCPIEDMTEHGCDGIYSDEFAGVVNWNELARRVMQWAEENPDPVYPSFLEWLHEMYPQMEGKSDFDTMLFLFKTRIPVDIAQKLEIKPR